MSSPVIPSAERASRIKLLGTVLAIVELENGFRLRAGVNQISANGGLLHLGEPLPEGIGARIMFQFGATTVRSKAAMLSPIWATNGCLQPFRFTDLDEQTRGQLDAHVRVLLEGHGDVEKTSDPSRYSG